MTSPVTPPAAPVVPTYPALGSPSFNAEAYAYGSGMPAVADGIKDLADNAFTNATSASESAFAAAGALSSAQTLLAFKGLWSSLAGALSPPATVLHNNTYWVLIAATADVTADVPGVSAKWSPQVLQARAIGAADLNAVVNGGAYSVASPTNGPVGVTDAIVTVTRAANALVQELVDNVSGAEWVRTVKDLSTAPVYSAWGRVTRDNQAGVDLAGGAIDCSKGTYFTETVSGARTLAFANIPTGAYACVLEVLHNSGAITLPAGSVWVAGAPPTLNTPKRHLLYFQRALTGTGGWIVSALPNSAA